MAARVAAVLGVKQEEAQRIFILFVASFFLGGSLLFFYTSSNAIFLTEFSADTLPYMYIVNAIFVIVFGYIYAEIEKRTSLVGLLTSSLAILTVTIFAFWISLSIAHSRVVIFVMMTWFRLLFIYTTLGLWELASAVFDVRQAKRLFSLVSLGLLLALIIGGLTVSFITKITGTVNLLLLSGIFLLLYAAIILFLAPKLGNVGQEEPKTHKFPIREMFKDRYIALIFLLKTITIINYYIVEFIFYKEAANQYPVQADLVSFLGAFIGISTLLMALIAALFTGRYITRFGLRVALLTTPILLLITAFASGSYGLFIGISDTTFFLLAISIKFSNEVFEKSLHIPTLGVLYQPIPRYKRMPVRVAVEGWFGSVALIGSGILLLIFNLLPHVKITFFIVLSFITTTLYIGITALVYYHYQKQLKSAVSARFLTGITLSDQTPDEEFVDNELHSDHPAKVLAALQYSHYIEQQPDIPYLISLLDHPSEDVKQDVLQRIEHLQYRQAYNNVVQLIADKNRDLSVRGQALITSASLNPDQSVDLLSKHLNTELQTYALIGLSKYGADAGRKLSYEKITMMAKAESSSDRMIAAKLIHDIPQQNGVLLQLLQDSDKDICTQAIRSSEKHLSSEVINLLLKKFQEAEFVPIISSILGKGDDNVVEAIKAQLGQFSEKQQFILLEICGKIGSSEAKRFLQEFLVAGTQGSVYDAALSSLSACGYKRDNISELISNEQQNAIHILKVYSATDSDLLKRALSYDFQRLRKRIFDILTFTYDNETIHNVQQSLQHSDQEHRANALELLDVSLSYPHKAAILPLVEDDNMTKRSAELKVERASDPILYLQKNAAPFSKWTQDCAEYVANQSQGQETDYPMYSIIEKVMVLRSVNMFAQIADPILAEIATVLREAKALAGDVLIEKGSVGNSLFIIVDGRVRVHDGDTTFQYLGSREIVGEMAVLDPAPRSATVTAETDTNYFVLEADLLYNLINTHPEINQAIIKILVQRIRSLDQHYVG